MFEALRWRLTAWYVLAFAAVFVIIGIVVFGWVRQRLEDNVHETVRQVSDASRRAVAEQGDAVSSEGRVRAILSNANLGGSADVFILLLTPDGSIAANPSDVPTAGLPAEASVARARGAGEDWQSINVGDQPLQIRTVAVYGAQGGLIGFVQAGKSVEDTNASLRTLAIVMAAGGLAGLALATAGGLFVAGIAIRPVRRGFERQREFVADASHELRTPLAVIRTNAEAIAASDHGGEAVDDIAAEASYMTRLLDDLLLLAGSDRGGVTLQRTRVDLSEVARETARVSSGIAERAGLKLDLDVGGQLIVDADAARCREVMLILIDNAVKYTSAGGSITLRAAAEGDDAVVSVADTGIGVPAEHVGRLFDRFYRVDKARSRAAGSAGLGLSIAREIVDAHGGTIEIDSAPGRGTTVTMRLKLASAA
jgi:two-component system sensor histidine kinase CiaH